MSRAIATKTCCPAVKNSAALRRGVGSAAAAAASWLLLLLPLRAWKACTASKMSMWRGRGVVGDDTAAWLPGGEGMEVRSTVRAGVVGVGAGGAAIGGDDVVPLVPLSEDRASVRRLAPNQLRRFLVLRDSSLGEEGRLLAILLDSGGFCTYWSVDCVGVAVECVLGVVWLCAGGRSCWKTDRSAGEVRLKSCIRR